VLESFEKNFLQEAGGPKIPMKYGRVDVTAAEQCPPEGRLPDAGPRVPADHLREVFYRMGLDDKVWMMQKRN
jgi:L-ascorbate peroxidase